MQGGFTSLDVSWRWAMPTATATVANPARGARTPEPAARNPSTYRRRPHAAAAAWAEDHTDSGGVDEPNLRHVQHDGRGGRSGLDQPRRGRRLTTKIMGCDGGTPSPHTTRWLVHQPASSPPTDCFGAIPKGPGVPGPSDWDRCLIPVDEHHLPSRTPQGGLGVQASMVFRSPDALTAILRGLACSATGIRTRSTPFS